MTAEGAGGGDGPEREPRSIRPFDDNLDLELGAVTLRQEEDSLRVVQLGGLARGVNSSVNEWCKTYTAVDTSPPPQWFSSAGMPEKELATDHGGARISGRLNGGPLAWSTWSLVWVSKKKKCKLWTQRLGYQGRTLPDSERQRFDPQDQEDDRQRSWNVSKQCHRIVRGEMCQQLLHPDEGGRIR